MTGRVGELASEIILLVFSLACGRLRSQALVWYVSHLPAGDFVNIEGDRHQDRGDFRETEVTMNMVTWVSYRGAWDPGVTLL